MSKVKILFCSHSPFLNGGEICLLTLLRFLDRQHFDPVVVFPGEGPLKQEVEMLGIKTHVSPLERWVTGENSVPERVEPVNVRVKKLEEIIERERPAIVHTNSAVVIDSPLAAKLAGIPHVWHIHEILTGHPSLYPQIPLPLLFAAIGQLADRAVGVSRSVERELLRYIPSEKVITIYNGVDGGKFQQGIPGKLRNELGFKDDDVLAVTIASLIKCKGIDNLLATVALLKQNNSKVRCVLVGAGPQDVFEEQIRSLGIADYISYLGFRDDIPNILADSDMLVIPSVIESFSLVAAEAMSVGKPVITTCCGGPEELVLEGETGWIVPVNDPLALSRKIEELAGDRNRMRDMGRKGKARFAEHFSAAQYAGQFAALYHDLMNSNQTVVRYAGRDRELFDGFLEAYQLLSDQILQLAESRKLVQEQDRQLAYHVHRLEVREEDVAKLTGWLEDQGRRVEQLELLLVDERKAHAEAIKQHEEAIKQIYRSLSWRLTAPLRWLGRVIAREE